MELQWLHNENEYLEERLSDNIPPLPIDTFSEECINCSKIVVHFCFLQRMVKQNNCCYYGKIELVNFN